MGKTGVWILGDQLLANHPALQAAEAEAGQENVRVLLVQSAARTGKQPYHRRKLVLLFSAMRHYAENLRERGYDVTYLKTPTFAAGLRQFMREQQPERLFTMAASEWNGRSFQQHQLAQIVGIPITLLPNTQFLVSQFDPYPNHNPDKNVIMEYFYREMRRHFDVLLENGQPTGGEWNYDKENRKPLPKNMQLPDIPRFAPDAITQEVIDEVEAAGHGVGSLADFDLAVTRQQALAAFDDFLQYRLPNFGAYEDAMTQRHQTLFHSVLSPYLNLGLLEPMEIIQAAEMAYAAGDAPINSVEGFVRQILGWREYIYWQYWQQMPEIVEKNSWNAKRPLPTFFWDANTEMNCLHHVIERAIGTGYNHHIERLMVLCNFCLLAGIEPMAVNDWFLAHYIDAYEWVMLPNVLGMGLNADGGVTATKPYIASANYINKMGDYCGGCRFNHKLRHGEIACPFNFLYWNFLLQHEETLRANPRLGPNVLGLRYLADAERTAVCQQAKQFLAEEIGR
ncbi:MAG: cryptochrome/photolyase family protein [Ardenticatenaceae bacterium]|nr:cryptochrome/photolyase family protein [Ardenticatenaceae bacterium]MCB8949611.1 cryptochrome/photolyase family protein [Ardenticatenaceae bacterium]